MRLNLRQKEFCKHYIITNNASKSYTLAGYKGKNSNTVGTCSYLLMQKPAIKQEIERLSKEINADLQVDCEYITRKLKAIVEASDTNVSDKIRALDLLGSNLGYKKPESQTLALFGTELIASLSSKARTSLSNSNRIDISPSGT